VVLTAVKKAEDAKGLIFRVYEWAGKELDGRVSCAAGSDGSHGDQPDGDAGGQPLTVTATW
jgi:alpha-mannosidase